MKNLKNGDLIKESWNFHGFASDVGEYVSQPKVFRFCIYFDTSWYDECRVNRMGWPVSNYSIEKIEDVEKEELIKNSKYDAFYKVYRQN